MNVFHGIYNFNADRGLIERGYDREAEVGMLQEELDELRVASDEHEEVDALGDIIVLASGALFKLGYDPRLVLLEILQEINSRSGVYNPLTGKWEKDGSHHYRASFEDCGYDS